MTSFLRAIARATDNGSEASKGDANVNREGIYDWASRLFSDESAHWVYSVCVYSDLFALKSRNNCNVNVVRCERHFGIIHLLSWGWKLSPRKVEFMRDDVLLIDWLIDCWILVWLSRPGLKFIIYTKRRVNHSLDEHRNLFLFLRYVFLLFPTSQWNLRRFSWPFQFFRSSLSKYTNCQNFLLTKLLAKLYRPRNSPKNGRRTPLASVDVQFFASILPLLVFGNSGHLLSFFKVRCKYICLFYLNIAVRLVDVKN